MKALSLTRMYFALVLSAGLASPAAVSDQADQLERQGRLREAAQVLDAASKEPSLPRARRQELAFELDRLERIRKDFPFSREELFEELKKSVSNLTAEEFEQWVKEGRFDSREIDGRLSFMVSSVSNLFFRYPELNSRRLPLKSTATLERLVWETCTAIKNEARSEQKPYVLPKRFHVTMNVTAETNAAPPGATIRAWIPIPRQYPFQDGFELVSASSVIKHLDNATSTARALYLEQRAAKSKPCVFTVDYNYTTRGVWFDLKPETVRPAPVDEPALKPFTEPAPHVVFTPEMRALSRQITGPETNPCLMAKKFYDWIAEHIQYSYAIEYSTIRNISDYCRTRGYGDCGQEALLFITLCRLNGIPARWQSGWNTFPGAKSIHDWTEIYLAPYGWVPVDPYMGVFAMRYANSLSPEQKHEIRDFYFGGLDQYRMAANSDHSQRLSPPKRSMRSDDVDFQRGELEWGDHNIYFDQYSWELKWQEIPVPRVIQ